MPRLPEPNALQAAAQALLRRDGAMELPDLAARLLAEGFDLGEDPEGFLDEELLARDDLDELPDGRLLDVAATVDGAVATRVLTSEDIATGVVRMEPELELLLLRDDDELPLPDGRTAEVTASAPDDLAEGLGPWVLSGPPGWLGHLQAGGLAAFRLAGGVLHVEPAETLADPDAAVEALAEAFFEQTPDGEPIENRHLLLAVLVDRPHVLAEPLPPLTDLLAAAGLETDGDWVGEQGTDWGPSDDEPWAYGLDAQGREALGLVLSGFRLSLQEEPGELASKPDLVESLAACLSMDGVAEAFLAEVLGLEADTETEVKATAGWARVLRDGAPTQPGPHLVLAGCMERLGDVEAAEAALRAALRADPEFAGALRDAAWYAEDRGDAAEALSLLRRLGADDEDPQVERLVRYASPGPMAAGRNQPCPCGSGRKYKVCCAERNGYPLAARVPWLLAKAEQYAQRSSLRGVLATVAMARIGGDPQGPAWVDAALGDPLVTDLALFDEGGLEGFCDERGPLLPADELALAREWTGAHPSVYEVTAVSAEEARLELRDLLTGDRVRVRERAVTAEVEAGELVFARLLAVSSERVLAPAVMRIPFTWRDRLLAFLDTNPGGAAIAAWFSRAEAPPELRNTDGDALVACTATLRVADPRAAEAALDDVLERGDDGWVDVDDRDGERVLHGHVGLAGDLLEVQTNSELRLESLLDRLTAAVDGLELVDEQRVPMGEQILAGGGAAAPEGAGANDAGGAAAGPGGEQIAEALDAFMQQAEQRWVDEAVPALGGVTPREAASDPTRRGDLERLLAEFDDAARSTPAGMGTFDVGRLRRLLGLA